MLTHPFVDLMTMLDDTHLVFWEWVPLLCTIDSPRTGTIFESAWKSSSSESSFSRLESLWKSFKPLHGIICFKTQQQCRHKDDHYTLIALYEKGSKHSLLKDRTKLSTFSKVDPVNFSSYKWTSKQFSDKQAMWRMKEMKTLILQLDELVSRVSVKNGWVVLSRLMKLQDKCLNFSIILVICLS